METIQIQLPSFLVQTLYFYQPELPHIFKLGLRLFENRTHLVPAPTEDKYSDDRQVTRYSDFESANEKLAGGPCVKQQTLALASDVSSVVVCSTTHFASSKPLLGN